MMVLPFSIHISHPPLSSSTCQQRVLCTSRGWKKKNHNKWLHHNFAARFLGAKILSGLSSFVCEEFSPASSLVRAKLHFACFFFFIAIIVLCVLHFLSSLRKLAECVRQRTAKSHKNLSKAQKCTRRAIKIISFALEKLPSAAWKLKMLFSFYPCSSGTRLHSLLRFGENFR